MVVPSTASTSILLSWWWWDVDVVVLVAHIPKVCFVLLCWFLLLLCRCCVAAVSLLLQWYTTVSRTEPERGCYSIGCCRVCWGERRAAYWSLLKRWGKLLLTIIIAVVSRVFFPADSCFFFLFFFRFLLMGGVERGGRGWGGGGSFGSKVWENVFLKISGISDGWSDQVGPWAFVSSSVCFWLTSFFWGFFFCGVS